MMKIKYNKHSLGKAVIIDLKVNVKLSLWSAIKLRIAGLDGINKKIKDMTKKLNKKNRGKK